MTEQDLLNTLQKVDITNTPVYVDIELPRGKKEYGRVKDAYIKHAKGKKFIHLEIDAT